MSHILIHSNNTGLVDHRDLFPTQIVFDKSLNDLEEVDFYLQRFVSTNTRSIATASAIFIKYSLTNNYSELIGLRLGHYIRLTKELNDGRCLPIIFLGNETPIEILKLSSLGIILATPGIYYVREEIESIRRVLNRLKNGQLTRLTNFKDYISKIDIAPPANYESHHAIANEWSVLRWAKVLSVSQDDNAISNIKQNIEGLLYYKFLQCKFPIEAEPDKARYKIEGKGKILYIDDEWNKGWSTVFNELFKISPDIFNQFCVLENSFKDKDVNTIVSECKIKIEDVNPDLVILDLRLADSDFNNHNTSELSGYKVLQFIKRFNPGIRVIIFTASNKVWNLIELQSAGADGFILKESPELTHNATSTKETIETFVLAIQEQLKYRFEKSLFNSCSCIRQNLKVAVVEENEQYNKFIKGLRKQLEVIGSSIEKIDLKRKTTIDIVYLACYNFLELFKDYYLQEGKDYRYYLGYEDIQVNRYIVQSNSNAVINQGEFLRNNSKDSPSWFNTMASLFIDYFNVSDPPYEQVVKLKRISEKRNDYIHGDKLYFEPNELTLIMNSLEFATKKVKE